MTFSADSINGRVVAERESGGRLWNFYLSNVGNAPLRSAVLEQVAYEWGDQYMDKKTVDKRVKNLAPGERALVWQDDGSSELRTDLWFRAGGKRWLASFPKLYRQQGNTLARALEMM